MLNNFFSAQSNWDLRLVSQSVYNRDVKRGRWSNLMNNKVFKLTMKDQDLLMMMVPPKTCCNNFWINISATTRPEPAIQWYGKAQIYPRDECAKSYLLWRSGRGSKKWWTTRFCCCCCCCYTKNNPPTFVVTNQSFVDLQQPIQLYWLAPLCV